MPAHFFMTNHFPLLPLGEGWDEGIPLIVGADRCVRPFLDHGL